MGLCGGVFLGGHYGGVTIKWVSVGGSFWGGHCKVGLCGGVTVGVTIKWVTVGGSFWGGHCGGVIMGGSL